MMLFCGRYLRSMKECVSLRFIAYSAAAQLISLYELRALREIHDLAGFFDPLNFFGAAIVWIHSFC